MDRALELALPGSGAVASEDARQACDLLPRKEREAFARCAKISFGFAQDRLSTANSRQTGMTNKLHYSPLPLCLEAFHSGP
jgi:hypothetical protein